LTNIIIFADNLSKLMSTRI